MENLKNFQEKIIDVPYYSEFDPIDGSNEHIQIFKRRSCGIVSAKMVLDYWTKKGVINKISLRNLIKSALRHKAYNSNSLVKNITGEGKDGTGWIHAGLVRTIEEVGLSSWRRMWFMRKFDLKYFKKEGLTKESRDNYYEQILEEANGTFKNSIDNGNPFLVSILKTLGTKKSPHLIVVTGYKLNGKGGIAGFFINDPHNPKNGTKVRPLYKDQFISLKEFDKIWRKRAIFVVPK